MDKKEEKDFSRGKRYCLRLLSARSRSESEIKDRLKRAGYNVLVAERILDSLKKERLVNDFDFAMEWISAHGNSRGVTMLVDELRQKGIDEKVIDEAIEMRGDELDEKETAKKIIEEKLNSEESEDIEKVKAKMLRHLVSKGFDREIAEDVINKRLN